MNFSNKFFFRFVCHIFTIITRSNLGNLPIYTWTTNDSKSFYDCKTGVFFISNSMTVSMIDSPVKIDSGASIWIYLNNAGNERVGILISSNAGRVYVGYQYGGENKLTWARL